MKRPLPLPPNTGGHQNAHHSDVLLTGTRIRAGHYLAAPPQRDPPDDRTGITGQVEAQSEHVRSSPLNTRVALTGGRRGDGISPGRSERPRSHQLTRGGGAAGGQRDRRRVRVFTSVPARVMARPNLPLLTSKLAPSDVQIYPF